MVSNTEQKHSAEVTKNILSMIKFSGCRICFKKIVTKQSKHVKTVR